MKIGNNNKAHVKKEDSKKKYDYVLYSIANMKKALQQRLIGFAKLTSDNNGQ
jgi:hypothetical protein